MPTFALQPWLLQPRTRWGWSRVPWALPAIIFAQPGRESYQSGQRSQDVLGLYGQGPTWLVVVCDGVSQSFFGDVGAWLLAEALLNFLMQWTPPAEPDMNLLQAWEASWREQAAARLQSLPVPEDLPPLVKRVMEEKRALGSEAMFSALRLDMPSPSYPQGRLLLLHGGNIRVRLWGPNARWAAPLREETRWSTRHGWLGEPFLWSTPLQDEHGQWLWQGGVLYTDGLFSLDSLTPPWPLHQARERAEQDWTSPLSDDQTYVELRWARDIEVQEGELIPWPTPQGEPQAPVLEIRAAFVQWQTDEHTLYTRLAWQGNNSQTQIWTTPDTQIWPPAQAQRVRAQAVDVWGHASPWSPWYTVGSTPTLSPWQEFLILGFVGALLVLYFVLLLVKAYTTGNFG